MGVRVSWDAISHHRVFNQQKTKRRLCFETASENKQAGNIFKHIWIEKPRLMTGLIRENHFSSVAVQQTPSLLLHVFKTFHTISFFFK